MKYQSGIEVMKGDHVLLNGDHGEVEFVSDPVAPDARTKWYVEEYGGGIMISELKHLGSVFVSNPEEDDELEFVSRG